eukprot:2385285-Amphidinium_carterae.1
MGCNRVPSGGSGRLMRTQGAAVCKFKLFSTACQVNHSSSLKPRSPQTTTASKSLTYSKKLQTRLLNHQSSTQSPPKETGIRHDLVSKSYGGCGSGAFELSSSLCKVT